MFAADYRILIPACNGLFTGAGRCSISGMIRVKRWQMSCLGLVLVLLGCRFGQPMFNETIADGQELPILRGASGTYSHIAVPLRVVIRDQSTWDSLPIAELEVDFDKEMVLVAAMGQTFSEYYGIQINRVWREGNVLLAEVEHVFPSADAPRRGHQASPYDTVVVPRCDLNVRGFSPRIPPNAMNFR